MGALYTAVLDIGSTAAAPQRIEVPDGCSLREAALDFAVDHAPDDDTRWQLRVWPGERAVGRVEPALVLGPRDLRAAERVAHVLRAGAARHRWRTEGPTGTVVDKRHASRIEPGERVLVTTDAGNSAVPGASGPLYVARDPRPARAATVRRRDVLMRGERVVFVDLQTSAGWLMRLRPDQPVIPAA